MRDCSCRCNGGWTGAACESCDLQCYNGGVRVRASARTVCSARMAVCWVGAGPPLGPTRCPGTDLRYAPTRLRIVAGAGAPQVCPLCPYAFVICMPAMPLRGICLPTIPLRVTAYPHASTGAYLHSRMRAQARLWLPACEHRRASAYPYCCVSAHPHATTSQKTYAHAPRGQRAPHVLTRRLGAGRRVRLRLQRAGHAVSTGHVHSRLSGRDSLRPAQLSRKRTEQASNPGILRSENKREAGLFCLVFSSQADVRGLGWGLQRSIIAFYALDATQTIAQMVSWVYVCGETHDFAINGGLCPRSLQIPLNKPQNPGPASNVSLHLQRGSRC